MKDLEKKIGLRPANILMPREDIDLKTWAVVAVDQFSSQPEYWEEVEELCKDLPSTLHMVFPEAYIGKVSEEGLADKINSKMEAYLKEGILVDEGPCFIYIDRKTPYVSSRKGLIVSLDLESYNYEPGSKSLIRATEETDKLRLPPRVKIRKDAAIEIPHIFIVIDDLEGRVIEPIEEEIEGYKALYDFDLMMDGGHIKGYKIKDEKILKRIMESLDALINPKLLKDKYGVEEPPFLYAVGDGNHSLASAKDHWDNIKKDLSEEERENHPARFALVELMNLHDSGIVFEPIHRLIFNLSFDDFFKAFKEFYKDSSYEKFSSKDKMLTRVKELKEDKSSHILPFINKEGYGLIKLDNPKSNLEVGSLQNFLDEYLKENDEIHLDYIHGEEVLEDLSREDNNLGFYLDSMDKKELFKTVVLDWVLPKKTFSMGEAEEKRYYLESKMIR